MAKRRLKSPDTVALITGDDERVTYRELADRVDRTSVALRRLGVQKGDAVAYLGDNSPEFVIALFAVLQLGAVFAPVNTRLAPPEIRHVVEDSGARVLIHDMLFAERIGQASLELAHIVANGEGPGGLEGLVREGAGGHTNVAVDLGDPAVIMYTSGTTGVPKGAVLTHGNLTWSAINCMVDYDVVSTDRALIISPLFHAAALGMGMLPLILKGATIVLERSFDPSRALALIERHGITMLSGVPTTYQMLADAPQWANTDLSSLHKLTCGGSAVPTRILDEYERRGLAFSQGYGMTEAAPGVTALSAAMTREKQGSVGVAHFFTDVRITDADGAVAPRGTLGQIEVSGANVFPGYLNLPDASGESFSHDGWFRSGDMGYLDADGYLHITDRLKDMIISGGENIYPAEVEGLIADIPGVSGVAVIGVPDERWGEVPWAIVTMRDGASLTTGEVRARLEGVIARYKVPRGVIVVDDLPRTASGKVRKADLRERFAHEDARQAS